MRYKRMINVVNRILICEFSFVLVISMIGYAHRWIWFLSYDMRYDDIIICYMITPNCIWNEVKNIQCDVCDSMW